jgi:hypothetical protein
MRKLAGLVALTVVSGILGGGAEARPDDAVVMPFGPGEECTFSIGYGVVTAGEATISVEGVRDYYGERVYHLRTRARSNRFFSAFFKVRDQADSYLDVDSLVSHYYFKQLREGDYRRDVEIHFDHDAGKAYFPDGREEEVPSGVQDVLSAFFRVRTMELEDGAEISIPTHGDKRMYDLIVKVHRREEIDTLFGRTRCILVQPVLREEGLFKHEGDLFVWLTDDERRIPVRMRANVPVGAIEAKLVDYEPPQEIVDETSDP